MMMQSNIDDGLRRFTEVLRRGDSIPAARITETFPNEPYMNFRPLRIAAEEGREDVVRDLMSTRWFSDGNSAALIAAVRAGQYGSAKALVDGGVDVTADAAAEALRTGNTDMMRLLADAQAPIQDESCVIS